MLINYVTYVVLLIFNLSVHLDEIVNFSPSVSFEQFQKEGNLQR